MFRIFELLSGLDSPQPVVVSLERNKLITVIDQKLVELLIRTFTCHTAAITVRNKKKLGNSVL